MFKSILVLEAPWDAATVKSTSVWPFVSEFSRVVGLGAYYQTFHGRSSFEHWIEQFNKDDVASPRLLYVAAHGSSGRIQGLQREINGATINEALRKAKKISYVHFGSCLFGSQENLDTLLDTAKHLRWAAGYDQAVDWIDSMALDLMFWSRIGPRDKDDKAKKYLKTHTLAKGLIAEVPGLARNLGFHLSYRWGKGRACLTSPSMALSAG